MSDLDPIQLIFWSFPIILLLYYAGDLITTTRLTRKNNGHPLVGSPSKWTPRVLLNLIFAANATELLQDGYRRFKTRTFQLIRGEGSLIILPLSTLEELVTLPPSIATGHAALEHDLLGQYTGLDIILESRMHHTIVQRKLTPRLPMLTPALQYELKDSLDNIMPVGNGWSEIPPFRLLGKVAARLSARAMVGPAYCRHPLWLDISVNYTESLFETIVIMRMFPSWTHPALSRCLPSWWRCQGYLKSAKGLLGPAIDDLIRRNDEGTWQPEATDEGFNVMAWMVEAAKGQDRNGDTLAHAEVLLALASVHTILVRIVNVLYDLIAHPEYIDELRDEIRAVEKEFGWDDPAAAYTKLHKMDSVLRESQRLSPPTTLGLKRLFKQSYTFSSGLKIEKGSYAALPVMAIENDPAHTTSPELYDGLRSYRLSQKEPDTPRKWTEHQFSAIEKTVLNFGYGKSACPGRYFASVALKMVFVKLLTEYEFRFLPGTGRPKNHLVHEFLFPWPWDKVQVRRREEECPF